MKKWSLLAALCFALSLGADCTLEQEKMDLEYEAIYVVSSPDSGDVLSAYSYCGDLLWQVPFTGQIKSFQYDWGQMYVYSFQVDPYSTTLSCIDAESGQIVWQTN
jgi:hypothetical protein